MLNKNKQTTVHADAQRKTHEQLRKELWISVAIAVARTEAARGTGTPGAWANQALKDFDEQFQK
jgi:hypothetical protein